MGIASDNGSPERMIGYCLSRTLRPAMLSLLLSLTVAAAAAPVARQAYTEQRRFLVKLLSVPAAIPLEQYFTVRLAAYAGKDTERRLRDVRVEIAAGMAHGLAEGFAHGMQSAPKVSIRDGVVTVSGLFFHMPGDWTMRVTVHQGEDQGTASFQLPCCEATSRDDRDLYTPQELVSIYRHSPLGPLPADPTNRVADDPQAAAFGQFLFFEPRFSPNRKVSCASCHQADLAFTDGRAVAEGMSVGTRNSPTVLNAAFGQWYFLDGRSDSLWSQALQPFENSKEIGGNRRDIVLTVAHSAELRAGYEKVFGPFPNLAHSQAVDRVFSNIGKAIEAYERQLRSPPSPFDRYVAALKQGDEEEQRRFPAAAKRGLQLFVGAARCELCHSGAVFSDGQFHNLGLPLTAGEVPDPGREVGIRGVQADPFNGVGSFSDAPAKSGVRQRLAFLPEPASQVGAFKTPSLREVARTAPYMHDGRFTDLAQVMSFYATGATSTPVLARVGQRERTLDLVPHLTPAQQSDLIEFLRTLTSPHLPTALEQAPAHP